MFMKQKDTGHNCVAQSSHNIIHGNAHDKEGGLHHDYTGTSLVDVPLYLQIAYTNYASIML